MTWFKVDDGFYSSRKVLSIPRPQRLAAVGLWTMAGNWSARELTDGVVPDYVLVELGCTPKLREALTKARLWLDHPDDGIEFANWAEYQPTRAQVEADRENMRERQRRSREKRRDEQMSHEDVTRDNTVSHSTPSRPVPTRPTDYLPESSHVGNREGYAQDEGEPVESIQARVLAAMGIRDVDKVRRSIGVKAQRVIDGTMLTRLVAHLLDKATPPVKDPQAYVLGCITNSWAEVQQFIDREVA